MGQPGHMVPVLSLELGLRPSPALVALAQMLALTTVDLDAAVERALAENPALARSEHHVCPGCGRVRRGRRCPWCLAGRAVPDLDRVDRVIPTGPDQLAADARLVIPRAEHPLVARVVAELDRRGLLGRDAAELSDELGVARSRVEAVIAALRQVGPTGVAARDVRECLLLQLDAMPERGEVHALARALLEHHFTELAETPCRLAEWTGTTADDVSVAIAFIARHLRPYAALDEAAPVTDAPPDVIVRWRVDGAKRLEVLVVGLRDIGLEVDPLYRALASSSARLSEPERRAITADVTRAQDFLRQIDERASTLRRVAAATVRYQRAFVEQGESAHRPLTRAAVAASLHLHESTVSRSVSNKRVRLPDGRTIPFSAFFGRNRSAQACLRAIVQSSQRPLSDTELAVEMAMRGFDLARRTVAKYRAQLGIPRQSR